MNSITDDCFLVLRIFIGCGMVALLFTVVVPVALAHDACFYTYHFFYPETPEQKLLREKAEWRGWL